MTAPSTSAPSAPPPTEAPTPVPTQQTIQPGSTWRVITVAPERRHYPYNQDGYRQSPSAELRTVEAQDGFYDNYTGIWFDSIKGKDIEHIAARSETHDSG